MLFYSCIKTRCTKFGSVYIYVKVAVKIVPRANFQLYGLTSSAPDKNKTPRQIAKEQAREKNREMRTIREAHIMMLLRHPHIVSLKDMQVSNQYFYILMEYVNGGQLLHYIVKRQRLSERRARHFTRQIVSALDYLHRNSIVHRDLKIENILIDKAGRNVKLIDFGLSNLFGPEKLLTTYCGSLYFAAPELLRASPYKGPEIDVWSLGVVIYVMVTGSVPFDDSTMPGLHEKIKRGQVAYPAHLSESCLDLLRKIFVTDPSKRMILADVIRHPWLNPDNNTALVKNFLPPRKPLTMPLDGAVLDEMTKGFDLGTVNDIRRRLELIIQSDVYKSAAYPLAHLQAGKPPSPPPMSQEERAMVPYDDPQSVPDAYHPLISLYHLTRERLMELEAQSGMKPVLSRKASVESNFSLNGGLGASSSARSSQASLQDNGDQQNIHSSLGPKRANDAPQGDVCVHPSSLPNRPDYQLLADASVPGFASQPSAAIGSGDYMSRIQRWLRSSTSQHALTAQETLPNRATDEQASKAPSPAGTVRSQHAPVPPPPQPSTPVAVAEVLASLPTPPDSSTNSSNTPATEPKRTLFHKLSNALLRRNSSTRTSASPTTQVTTPSSVFDRPLPPLPPEAQKESLPDNYQQDPSISPPQPAVHSPFSSVRYKNQHAAEETSPRRQHQRSSSSVSEQQHQQRQRHGLSAKLGSWLNRSASIGRTGRT